MNLQKNKTKGFTLIELLVVIAIIGLLSSVVLASMNSARAKARDAVRISSLKTIQNALELYYSKCNTYVVAQNCTGTAYGSGGWGWFDYPSYSSTAGSVAQGLIDAGVIGAIVIDPSGMITSNGVNRSGYMIGVNNTRYTIWANLENPSASNTATQNSCFFSSYDNYSSSYPVAARANYCISN